MKLKTSLFDFHIFKKDILRFLPLWLVYFIGGSLIMVSLSGMDVSYGVRALGETIGPLSIVNMIYAALAAMLLFGDLFQSRMCNALHALPIPRECWFFSHLAAGLCFSLVPNCLGMVLIMFQLEGQWFVVFPWLLGMTLEYLFFFGLAVFSIMLSGNRIGAAAFYSIANFGAYIVYWFFSNVYAPVLFGFYFDWDLFATFCPVIMLAGMGELVLFERFVTATDSIFVYVGLGAGWGYLSILAVLGVVFIGLALTFYKKRQLECAGDFISFGWLAPLFSLVYTLCVGAVFALAGQLFGGVYQIFLLAGLLVGYFTGQMLLRRTVKVFQWKTVIRAAILALAMLGSVLAAKMDVFGVVNYQPSREEISKIVLSDGGSKAYFANDSQVVLTGEDIDVAMALHKQILQTGPEGDDRGVYFNLELTYVLKNGKTVTRNYTTRYAGEKKHQLNQWFSRPEAVLAGLLDNTERVISIEARGNKIPVGHVEALINAMQEDCVEGNMAQSWQFHQNEDQKVYLTFQWRNSDGTYQYYEYRIWSRCRHTLKWLEENTTVLKEDKEMK